MTRVFPWIILFFLFPTLSSGQADIGVVLPDSFEDWDAERVYEFATQSYNANTGSPFLALSYNEIGYERAVQEGNHERAALFSSQISMLYSNIGMNELGLRYSLESFSHAKATPDKEDNIWALFRLSDSHSSLKNQTKAMEEARKSLDLALQLDNSLTIGWAYNMVGETFRHENKPDSAKVYYEKGIEFFKSVSYQRGQDLLTHNLSLAYVDLEEYDLAFEIFNTTFTESLEGDLSRILEEGAAKMKAIAAMESLEAGIAHGREMLEIAKEADMRKWQRNLHSGLAVLYRSGERWEEAWIQEQKADSLDMMISGERIQLQTELLEKQFELALVNAEKDLLLQESRNERLFSIAVIAISALLLLIALILITNNQKSRRINKELAHRNKQLDELVMEKDTWMNLMAHDLKAPLNSIKGLLRIVENPETPHETRLKVFGHINKAIDKGTELISQLLELAQVESDEFQVNVQPTLLNTLLEDVRESFSSVASTKQISLKMEMPDREVQLQTDPMIVQRIMENFLSNAIKFSPFEREVLLGLEQGKEAVLLRITDQGPGLSPEDQQNLFQKFRKLSAKPTAGESSTGLGLSIVKELANKLNAEIIIESKLGEGSTFSLAFPYSN